jgi:hypothetical protein
MANKVISVEHWYNEASIEQAWSRVHRIGQTKPCEHVSIVTQGTAEEQIVAIAKEKKRDADKYMYAAECCYGSNRSNADSRNPRHLELLGEIYHDIKGKPQVRYNGPTIPGITDDTEDISPEDAVEQFLKELDSAELPDSSYDH